MKRKQRLAGQIEAANDPDPAARAARVRAKVAEVLWFTEGDPRKAATVTANGSAKSRTVANWGERIPSK